MKIWIDADSCPVQIRNIVLKGSERTGVEVTLVANREIPFKKNKRTDIVIVADKPDAADLYIIDNCKTGDLVITRDIPMAAELVQKDISVINDRGYQFTKENIGERLSMRNFMLDIRLAGLKINEDKCFSKKEIQLFSNTFDRIMTKMMKNIYK